jgi:hypothetical protein
MKSWISCVLLVLLTGCHKPENYVLGPSDLEKALSVSLSSAAVPADGISRVTITVQLDPDTDADKRNVKFMTTAGTFIAAGQEGLSITVPADADGKAVVSLRSSITPANAQLEISVASLMRRSSVAFTAVPRADAFDHTISRTSIPADGFSTTLIIARLKLGAGERREVTFETSAGIFIASGQPNGRSVKIVADSNGRAEVHLRSEKTVGIARVQVTALAVLDEFLVAFTPVDAAQIITLSTEPSSAPADGVTPLVIVASIAPGLPTGRRTVTFTTTIGQLSPASIETDSTNMARSYLVSSVTGTAHITATVDGTTAASTAELAPALPDRLHISLDDAELKSTESTIVRVTLLRTNGSVSPHLRVSYTARTSAGESIGSFSAVSLAENAVATATFNLGTTSYSGAVTVRASAEGGAAASATVRVIP